ncbi:SHOCT domain-containing protein [Natrinema sp. 74]|uniref:SHOCT domain-containing protein n=1 Tax=Natrinema sp. 74 TaxID=3384159 RepID=UPI0038D38B80
MPSRLQRFIAEDGWLLIAIVTLALTSVVAISGLGVLAAAISIIGWFLLMPILLFWGEEIATALENDDAPTATASDPTSEADPLDELKRRYAAGEIDDAEFERRLERLVAVDDLPDDVLGGSDADDGPSASGVDVDRVNRGDPLADSTGDDSDERDRERETER